MLNGMHVLSYTCSPGTQWAYSYILIVSFYCKFGFAQSTYGAGCACAHSGSTSQREHMQVSAAMGNASDEVKKVASFVAPTNNEAGVAYAIRKALGLPNLDKAL